MRNAPTFEHSCLRTLLKLWLSLLLWWVLSSRGFGQDCSKLVTAVTDKVAGKPMLSTPEDILVSDDDQKTGFAIQVSLPGDARTIAWTITAKGAGSCVDPGDDIRIVFTDQSRLVLKNAARRNCEQRATVFFGGRRHQYPDALEQLRSKKITSLTVITRDGLVQNDFTEDEASTLMQTFDCLSHRVRQP